VHLRDGKMNAKPFFVVSSGRSGTATLQKVLSQADGIEMHHEYMVHIVQPLAVRRYMGWIGSDVAADVLRAAHGAAIHYSQSPQWGDSSNKLSWLVPELAALFPEAKFVHLARDGRKVTSSYFHKLAAECYDDHSTQVLTAHAEDPGRHPAPPPEKKYWWPLPRRDNPVAPEFARFDQFARIAWHWSEIHSTIIRSLAAIDPRRSLFVRLEDLQESPAEAARLFHFLELPYRREFFAPLSRPHNVNVPIDRPLDATQLASFERVAAGTMSRLGYAGKPEYVVNY
jgi:hypothetical protein